MVQREKNRLRTVLTKACSVRLKDSKGRSGSSRKKKPAKGEEPEEPENSEAPENEAPVLENPGAGWLRSLLGNGRQVLVGRPVRGLPGGLLTFPGEDRQVSGGSPVHLL